MRVPVQAPALVRSHRGGVVRWSGGRRTDAYGVSPSQYEGEDGEAAEDDNGEAGDEGGNDAESSVESEE